MWKVDVRRPVLRAWVILSFLWTAGFVVAAQASEEQGSLEEQIMALPMWDVHNHLTKEVIVAQNFWDVAHYFWFLRELKGVGYPDKNVELSEEERRVAFLQALELTKNTSWNQLFRQSMIDLYGIEVKTPEDIESIQQKIEVTRTDPEWSNTVCDKIGVKMLSLPIRAKGRQNGLQHVDEGRLHYYAHLMMFGRGEFGPVRDARNVTIAVEEHLATKLAEIDEYFAKGVRVFRYNPSVRANGDGRITDYAKVGRGERDEWRIKQYIGHKILEHMNAKGAVIQLFFGVMDMMPEHQQNRFLEMRSLFTTYPNITFELLPASHENNLDIVQAARSYRNVHPGGMWWLTYRRSVLLENMQVRVEALAAPRSSIVTTDARHIEWVYIKCLLIKRTLVEFMEKQVADGWLTEEEAVDTARWWLYDATEALYLQKPLESYLK